ncbi:MAG: hydroxymethylglutaryl-CoA lyase [Rhodocyclaceae bacterium]
MRDDAIDIVVSEVGPRDGLQSVKQTMPTASKLAWIGALHAAGLREIEVASFVPASLLPQMADAAEVVTESTTIEGLTVLALAPNLKGVQRAVQAGAHKVTLPVSASRQHSLANIRKTPEDAVDEVRRVCAWRDELGAEQAFGIEVGISTAFGCTLEGCIDEDWLLRLALSLAQAGVDSIGLSDTTGHATPTQVKRLFRLLRSELGDKAGAAHLHNTRGQGLANVVAALDAGVTTFDASQAGLGGCPYAPGASGNIVTEDLVFMLEAMGLRTGIDIERLLAARSHLAAGLPGEPLYGHVAQAGLPNGFLYADGRAP